MRWLESLFIVALILYTIVIWWHHRRPPLTGIMLALFGAALMADVAGTVFLCVAVAKTLQFTVHTVTGLASLAIMAVHFLWALGATLNGYKYEANFYLFSPYAWALWQVSFWSGVFL